MPGLFGLDSELLQPLVSGVGGEACRRLAPGEFPGEEWFWPLVILF